MVRLVFRPYTQVWRTICTSVSLRASTRVSPGFTQLRHSSPSFGSWHICSNSNNSHEDHRRSSVQPYSILTLTFISRLGLIPLHSHICQTPWSVFQDGPAKTNIADDYHKMTTKLVVLPKKSATSQHSQIIIDIDLHCWRCPLHKYKGIFNWKFLSTASPSAISGPFNSLFKVLFIFPSRYLFAIGILLIFSFGWNLSPT